MNSNLNKYDWKTELNMASPRHVQSRKFKQFIRTLGAFIVSAFVVSVSAKASEENKEPHNSQDADAIFNPESLARRGLDPKIAEFLNKKPRFQQGVRRITLLVNGISRGSVDARFDSNGELCFDQALLDQGNLKVPDERQNASPEDPETCHAFLASFPQTELELRPSREEVALVVSTEAQRQLTEERGVFQEGGAAGLVNYDLFVVKSNFGEISTRHTTLNTVFGFNVGDWLMRSRQVLTEQNGDRRSRGLYTFAQKTFVNHRSMLQVGEINITNSVFPGYAITGFQMLPDHALQVKSRGGATVEGIAYSQAQVEVRQAGSLIHTTLVPAGPFRLSDIQLLAGNTDLDVRVIEANGEQRNFTVAAAALAQFSYTAPGYSMAVGQVRQFDKSEMHAPVVVTGTGGWLLTPQNKISSGVLLSQSQYQAAALTVDSSITPSIAVNVRTTVANAGDEGVKGAKAGIALSARLTKELSVGANATRRTEGFRDLLDTTKLGDARYMRGASIDQYGTSLSWRDSWMGEFALGYSTSNSLSRGSTQSFSASWSRRFTYFNLNANVMHSASSSYETDRTSWRSKSNEKAMYLSVSVPLGTGRSLRTYANKNNGRTTFGTNFSDSSGSFANYQVAADSNTENRQRNFSGNVGLLPRYTNMSLGYARYGEDNSSYNGRLSGGMVLHEGGLTLSPYSVEDTFAVAKIGSVSGVKLNTPSGAVWTDAWGQAVVPRLSAFNPSQVEIATNTLPRNVDIKNGQKKP